MTYLTPIIAVAATLALAACVGNTRPVYEVDLNVKETSTEGGDYAALTCDDMAQVLAKYERREDAISDETGDLAEHREDLTEEQLVLIRDAAREKGCVAL